MLAPGRRFRPGYDKGPDVAARICRRLGLTLRPAGPVGGIERPAALERALAAPRARPTQMTTCVLRGRVALLLDGEPVRWEGRLEGERKLDFLARAKEVLASLVARLIRERRLVMTEAEAGLLPLAAGREAAAAVERPPMTSLEVPA